ncbi:MAG: hypothetical protein KDH96_05950 [Candidatus Riesia sp.]|nr:hypothetical protein [Candidatus Riesia sp.]
MNIAAYLQNKVRWVTTTLNSYKVLIQTKIKERRYEKEITRMLTELESVEGLSKSYFCEDDEDGY